MPAHAVLGYVSGGSGSVKAYYINSYDPATWQRYSAANIFATAMGVTRSNGRTTMCFSTRLGTVSNDPGMVR